MAPSALPGNESAPSPRAAAPSGGVGPIAPVACHKSLNGRAPRVTIAALGNVLSRSGSGTKPSATGTLPMARASRLSPSGRLSPSVLISARPVTDPSRRASAAGEPSSGSANSTSIAIAAGRLIATASISRATVSRGHGQAPSLSIDARSMSTTSTFSSDVGVLRSHWSPASSMSKALSRSTSFVVWGNRIAAARKTASNALPTATGRRCRNALCILPIEEPLHAKDDFVCWHVLQYWRMVVQSADACECGADALWSPLLGRRRCRAGRDKIRAFALLHNHLLTRGDYRDRAARHEHAEAPIARTGEELRAAYRDQGEGARKLHCRGGTATRLIEQQRPGPERHCPAGIDEKTINLESRLLAKSDHRIPPEPHCQPRCVARGDFVAEKERRRPIERSASRVELRVRLTLDILDRANRLRSVCWYEGKDERECRRSMAEEPTSIAGSVAFDLADVGHRRSPSAWYSSGVQS